jgi:hypothetical protein
MANGELVIFARAERRIKNARAPTKTTRPLPQLKQQNCVSHPNGKLIAQKAQH